MGQEAENIDVDRVVRDINASVADVLTRSLAPYIRMASESTAQCSAVSEVLRRLPEFQELLEEKVRLAAEVAELRTRLATAESSGIRLRVSELDELPSSSYLVPTDTSIADLTQHLYGSNTISRAQSPSRDSLSDDESEEGSSGSEPTAASEMPTGMEGLLAAARKQPDSPYTPRSSASVSDCPEATEDAEALDTSRVVGDEREVSEDQEGGSEPEEGYEEAVSEEDTGSDGSGTPSFPSHPQAAHVEVSMDEEEDEDEGEEEELYEIDFVLPGDTEPTSFYTSDVENGIIYEIDDDEAPGEEVGRLKNGIPDWATE